MDVDAHQRSALEGHPTGLEQLHPVFSQGRNGPNFPSFITVLYSMKKFQTLFTKTSIRIFDFGKSTKPILE